MLQNLSQAAALTSTLRTEHPRLAATLGSKSTFRKLPKRSVLVADINQLCELIAEPAEPLLLPHEASRDCVVGENMIPRGTMVLVNSFPIHRDPNVWVQPNEFILER